MFKTLGGFFRRRLGGCRNVSYRTEESDPLKHDRNHLGKLYTVPSSLVETHLGGQRDRFPHQFLPRRFMEYGNAVREHAIMVRLPALEIFHYLNQVKDRESHLKLNLILYGPFGSGKTTTLGHVMHYGLLSDYVVLHFYQLKRWLVDIEEMAHSTWKTGRIDHIFKSLTLLKEFSVLNGEKIADLKTHKDYVWTAREKIESGSKLTNVLEHGIARPKFANDVLNVLLKELQWSCSENKCKFMVLADGINCIFDDLTACHREKLTLERIHRRLNREFLCKPDELSVIYNLKKFLRSNVSNVSVISTVDWHEIVRERPWERAKPKLLIPSTHSDTPLALLGERGWKGVGPFIPIHVGHYTREELNNLIDYNIERKYIQKKTGSKVGREEIAFLTGGNPQDFAIYSNFW